MGRRIINLTGKKLGFLTAIEPVRKNGIVYWHCKCVCGKDVTVRTALLTSGRVRSCGCRQHEVKPKTGTTFLTRERQYLDGIKQGEQEDANGSNGNGEDVAKGLYQPGAGLADGL